MKRIALALVLSFFASAGAAESQTNSHASEMPYAGAPCAGDGGIGASPDQVAAFRRFDSALRSALKRNEVVALAFLVNFPLRVNTNKGTLLIPDARSLDGHYAEIFLPEVRNQVLSTASGDYICRYDEGLGYKTGVIWVSTDGHKFHMDAVNTPDLHAKADRPTLAYTCETKTHRISIEDLNNGKYRYRSWNKPKKLTEVPDLEISDGKLHFEGTGVCAYPVYTFNSGKTVYELQGSLGCGALDHTPKNATGQLSISIRDETPTDTWCY